MWDYEVKDEKDPVHVEPKPTEVEVEARVSSFFFSYPTPTDYTALAARALG